MLKEIAYVLSATLVLALSLVIAPAFSDDKAPMPQTRGMAGMDPRQHDQPVTDPYEGCVLNSAKAAQQAEHPMPETKGMKGMDPKAHVMDCPEGYVPRKPAGHVHKAPGN